MLTVGQAQPDHILAGAFIGAAAVTVVWLWRAGALREQTLRVVDRPGRFTMADLLIGLGLMIMGPSVVALATMSMGDGSPEITVQSIVLAQVGWVPVVVFILIRGQIAMKGGLATFGFGLRDKRRTGQTTALGIPAMLLITIGATQVVLMLTVWMGQTPPDTAHPTLQALATGALGRREYALILSAVVAAPVLEEMVFRGLFQTVLVQSGAIARRWTVVLLVAALFTVFHAGAVVVRDGDGNFVQFAWQALVTLGALAVCLGYVYERTGSLWPSIVLHATFNTLNIAVVIARGAVAE